MRSHTLLTHGKRARSGERGDVVEQTRVIATGHENLKYTKRPAPSSPSHYSPLRFMGFRLGEHRSPKHSTFVCSRSSDSVSVAFPRDRNSEDCCDSAGGAEACRRPRAGRLYRRVRTKRYVIS